MNLTDIREVKVLLARHGFHFSKSMGQNFLIADWVPQNIAAAAGLDETCAVLEIGPGIGSLTQHLARQAGKVAAVELDTSLLPILDETLADCSNVEIIPGDVLKLDFNALIDDKFFNFTPKACANLPYNITTPVLTRLLECGRFRSITVMIQREVARRICAAPGDSDCGAFSLFCQYYAHCELLFEVPPDCFLPVPKVTSAVVQLIPHPTPPIEGDRDAIFSVINAAFAQRRKTLLNALSSAYGRRLSKDELRQILLDCGLSETVRGERLGLAQFSVLAQRLK
ncbi:MAG: 16S rRNA (adenine(1518)-N(6)/adenine(1519)-N(6))-dimethyltransferase RsmA [Oscillospiraceae bacterium]|nr:16S rRNA (adenine(1518)-N(6)/adenine(1519)-N(6))-dimethyltransferase RsmA [Oscillospiraceae bacterium]MDE7171079.1 16S rRNA (adenine(1518)-N(6)/adenine(1519)-N(6))-dimethyltransferase RsmA [Oscillospiraceae bacterium]